MAAGTGFADDKYDVFRPEFWSPRVSRFMKEKLYAASFFNDRSSELAGGDTLHIPHISDAFTASDIPVTSGDVTATDISETKTDLVVDQWKGAAYYITKFEEREIMKRPSIINEYAKAMGYRLGRKMEQDLLDNITQLDATAGNTTSSLVATNIETALGILTSNSVPRNECRMFLDPKVYWGDLMTIQKYYDASQFGKPSVPQGAHDLLYGIPVVLSPNTPYQGTGYTYGHQGGIIHRDAVSFAYSGPDFSTTKGEYLRKKIISDLIYGDKTVQSGWGVALLATS